MYSGEQTTLTAFLNSTDKKLFVEHAAHRVSLISFYCKSITVPLASV